MATLTYTVIVSGVSFSLSEASIRSDSPDTNLLAMSLLGDFAEAQDRTLVLNRNATTFKLIRDHLAGYTVFPLVPQDYPGMEKSKFMRYLRDDCDYYGLENLHKALKHQAALDVQDNGVPSLKQLRDAKDRYEVQMETYDMRLKASKQNVAMLKTAISETTTELGLLPHNAVSEKSILSERCSKLRQDRANALEQYFSILRDPPVF